MPGQSQNKIMVQATNNTSIVSKNSACSKGYFEDSFLHYFGRSKQRTALINRGYYIRAKAVDSALQKFLAVHANSYFQIVSLGAGFDTTYFKIKSQLPDTAKFLYVEVDFKSVIKRKLKVMDENPELKDLVGSLSKLRHPRLWIYTTEQYVACGLDISKIAELDLALWAIDLDFKAPTLVISECVLSYIHPKKGDIVIEYMSKSFPNAAFLAYEQVFPGDAFGTIMCNHFERLQSPLHSLAVYTTPEEQCSRYTSLGWASCDITNMNDFYSTIPAEEHRRIVKLEVFDEFEEWHLKCAHYTLLCAHQGKMSSLLSCGRANPVNPRPRLEWKLSDPNPHNMRCGHQTVAQGDQMVSIGGYGTDPDSVNQRLTSLLIHDSDLGITVRPNTLPSKTWMHSTATLLPSSGEILVVGGRGNPLEASKACIRLGSDGQMEHSSDLPSPRWRHSASILHGAEPKLLVFGGLEPGFQVSGDCFLLDLQSFIWTKMKADSKTAPQPCPRHSHSSISWRDSVVLSGGLDSQELPLSCIHQFRDSGWSPWKMNGSILPRYSHTSHILQDRWLLLVGGVNNLDARQQPGVGVVDLQTLAVQEFALPVPRPDNTPFLCYKHSSVLADDQLQIVGGGGYCFSFGIHLNPSIASVPQLSSLIGLPS